MAISIDRIDQIENEDGEICSDAEFFEICALARAALSVGVERGVFQRLIKQARNPLAQVARRREAKRKAPSPPSK